MYTLPGTIFARQGSHIVCIQDQDMRSWVFLLPCGFDICSSSAISHITGQACIRGGGSSLEDHFGLWILTCDHTFPLLSLIIKGTTAIDKIYGGFQDINSAMSYGQGERVGPYQFDHLHIPFLSSFRFHCLLLTLYHFSPRCPLSYCHLQLSGSGDDYVSFHHAKPFVAKWTICNVQ